jgi:hypothetical protein
VLNPSGGRASDLTRLVETIRWLAMLAAIVLLIWLLSDIVLVVFMAVLIAVMLRGAADWAADNTGISQRTMLALVSVSVVAVRDFSTTSARVLPRNRRRCGDACARLWRKFAWSVVIRHGAKRS